MKVTPTLQEIITQGQKEAQNQFGNDYNVTEESDFYRISYPVFALARLIYDYVQDRFDNLDLRKAEDPYFYGRASDYLFYRKMPSYATGTCQVTDAVVGAYAEIGEIKLRRTGTDLIYSNTEEISVDELPFTFKIQSDMIGEIGNCEIGEINELISSPANWGETFENITVLAGGQDLEELEDARKRFFASGSTGTVWNADGIKAKLLAVDGVKSVTVEQNRSDDTVGELTRRTIRCIVDGGVDDEIFKVLLEIPIPAIELIGDTRTNLTDTSGQLINVGFDRPTEVPIEFKIMTIPSTYPSDFDTAMESWGEETNVGGTLSTENASCYIRDNVASAINYTSIYVMFKRDAEYVLALELDSDEKAVLSKGSD